MHHGLIPWLVIDWRSENIINSKVTRSTLFVFDDKVGRQVFIGETFKWMSPGSPSRYSLFVSASVTAEGAVKTFSVDRIQTYIRPLSGSSFERRPRDGWVLRKGPSILHERSTSVILYRP